MFNGGVPLSIVGHPLGFQHQGIPEFLPRLQHGSLRGGVHIPRHRHAVLVRLGREGGGGRTLSAVTRSGTVR